MKLKLIHISSLLIILLIAGCPSSQKAPAHAPKERESKKAESILHREVISTIERAMQEGGLINILTMDSTFVLNIKYSTTDNFMKTDLYGSYEHCYLQADVAKKLVNAHQYLKEEHPDLRIMIFDGARPQSVQQKMWDFYQIPLAEKIKFLSNPTKGSVHNYGAAVDVSLCNKDGKELEMGTPFDSADSLAYPILENYYLGRGLLPLEIIKNRQLLRKIMYEAGFFNIQTEWWHFNSCTREKAMERYRIIK